jgi:hypothetical protein
MTGIWPNALSTRVGPEAGLQAQDAVTPRLVGRPASVRPHLAEAGELAVLQVNQSWLHTSRPDFSGHYCEISDHTGVRGDVRDVRTLTGPATSDA